MIFDRHREKTTCSSNGVGKLNSHMENNEMGSLL
jgi:hypothetical protein